MRRRGAEQRHRGQVVRLVHDDRVVGNDNPAIYTRVFDVDENSETFGTQVVRIRDEHKDQQFALSTYGAVFHPKDSALIFSGYRGGIYDPSWIDFDALWQRMGWPGPQDQMNPYYLVAENISNDDVTRANSICYMQTITELAQCGQECPCLQTCASVPGGCTLYHSMSTYLNNILEARTDLVNPVNVEDYAHLRSILDAYGERFYSQDFQQLVNIPPIEIRYEYELF